MALWSPFGTVAAAELTFLCAYLRPEGTIAVVQ
jgi:hypothetical protein